MSVVKDKVVAINKIWLAESSDFFEDLFKQKKRASYFSKQVLQLGAGERLVYEFRSIAEIDIFLLNLLYDLLLLKAGKNVLILEQHEFFVVLNNQRTNHILREMDGIGASACLLIRGESELDKEIRRHYLKDLVRAHVLDEKSAGSNKIIHFVGDIAIELRLDKKLASAVEGLFSRHSHISPEFVGFLRELASKKWHNKLVIYKDHGLAKKNAHTFKKYFMGI